MIGHTIISLSFDRVYIIMKYSEGIAQKYLFSGENNNKFDILIS